MYGGGVQWPGSRAPIPASEGTCKGESKPPANDPSGTIIANLDGCPDPSDNYFCTTDQSCIPKCFSNADCGDLSDCSENMCVPKRTDIIDNPIKTEMTSEEKLKSMTSAFTKSEKDAMESEYQAEKKRAEKERNKELLLAFNETMETGTRRRGIKTRERQELEDEINNSVSKLKRNQDKEKRELSKQYRQAINAKDNLKKNYLIKVIEDLADIHREERERLKEQSHKRRNFLKEKQANINERNQVLKEYKNNFDEKISRMQKT